MEYVPEKAELEDGIDEEFRKIFEKFSFQDSAGAEVQRNHLIIYFDLFFCFVIIIIVPFPWGYIWPDALHLLSIQEDKKDESAQNAASNKKADSDSEEEEQDNQQKDKGMSNKKKKVLMIISNFFL